MDNTDASKNGTHGKRQPLRGNQRAPGERAATAETHEVVNQPPALVDYNPYDTDVALREGVRRHGAAWAEAELSEHGARCGSAEVIEWGFLANEYAPRFFSHDRQGFRVDEVRYHEAYHRLMGLALEGGLHSSPWSDPRPGAHVARAAKYFLQAQVESGHGCPVTMTFAAVPTLRLTPQVGEAWIPKVLHRGYDPRNVTAADKRAVTIGMGMTEKQGGSDVRANTTRAEPLGAGGPGEAYALTGHKWFTSAPMCDAFLMLAQAPGGLSCFLVPRWRPDGSKNPILVQRLKNKMGNVSNASSEIELHGALGWMIGEEARGVRAIIEMVAMTRFDCMIGSTAAQRQALAQAAHHCAGRSAFGKALIDQPLMRNVLADLQLEVEGALAMTLRMAEALDRSLAGSEEEESLLLRMGLPVGKYWICKRTPGMVYEAMECLGGNGVTEDFILARLYRDAPVNAIWEGSGNIQALDVLRAAARTPQALEAFFAELEVSRGDSAELDRFAAALADDLADPAQAEFRARDLAERLALALQAHLLVRAGDGAVADAFVAARLGGGRDRCFGSLAPGAAVDRLVERALPVVG
jgi:putative acyl-CoA dehydrogenase